MNLNAPRIRKVCKRGGHRWIEMVGGYRPPYQHCARMFCDGARVDPHLPKELRHRLERAAPVTE